MKSHQPNKISSLPSRALSLFIAITFLSQTILPPAYAQVFYLPAVGTMVNPSAAFVPVLLKGMTVYPDNPLRFDFIVDSGNTKFSPDQVKEESNRLVKYFLAAMTVPQDDLWVNLSPYEADRVIPDALGLTELGRDMLAQDYLLKQLSASLLSPDKDLGKDFWARVYKKAQAKFGTTNIPVNTFNKVWIMPNEATVYEKGNAVYIVKSRLKVMLDEDYQAMQNNKNARLGTDRMSDAAIKDAASLSSQVVREIILPEIEREVNEGENFAPIRQIYQSLILAQWYKETVKASLLSKVYIDQKKIKGVDLSDPTVKDQIYAQYVEAFKKGVFNFIKKDYDEISQQPIPRKYFSGGEKFGRIALKRTNDVRALSSAAVGDDYQLALKVEPAKDSDSHSQAGALIIKGKKVSKSDFESPGSRRALLKEIFSEYSFVKEAYEAGVLGELILRWHELEYEVQFGSHSDTVAEHTMENLGALYAEGLLDKTKYSTEVLMTTFFHDFGKDMKFRESPDKHALEGSARVKKILIDDFGFDAGEAEQYAWYVHYHPALFLLSQQGSFEKSNDELDLDEFLGKINPRDVEVLRLFSIGELQIERGILSARESARNRERIEEISARLMQVAVAHEEHARAQEIVRFKEYLNHIKANPEPWNSVALRVTRMSDAEIAEKRELKKREARLKQQEFLWRINDTGQRRSSPGGEEGKLLQRIDPDTNFLYLENSFKTGEVKRIWKFIKNEIEKADPYIINKKEGILSKIFQQINARLHSIDKKIQKGEIKLINDLHLFTEQGVDYSIGKEPVRMGILGLTANPLTFGHIAASLTAIDELNLNVMVLLVQGGMKYKDLLEQDRVPEKVRHEMTKDVIKELEPIIQYTDVGRNSEQIGEFLVYKLLSLNPNRKIEVIHGIGSESEDRVRGIIKNALLAAEKHKNDLNENHKIVINLVPIDEFDQDLLNENSLNRMVEEIKADLSIKVSRIAFGIMLKDYNLVVHSTAYRRGDRSLVPSSVDEKAKEEGFYGYPPSVIVDGRKVTMSMDEVIKKRLKPFIDQIADIIMKKFKNQGAIVTIDGNSASGKSLVAELLNQELLRRKRNSAVWELDTVLKNRKYRHAIQKLVVGENLDQDEAELFTAEERNFISSQKEYLDEMEFFQNDRIQEELQKVRNFYSGNDATYLIRIDRPYDQKTKEQLAEPLSISLKKDSILIVEGKYSNLRMLQNLSDYKIRIKEDPESVQVRFELRTRSYSPNDADRQLVFFRKALTPSFDKYASDTGNSPNVIFDVSSAYPEKWDLLFQQKKQSSSPVPDNVNFVPKDWMKNSRLRFNKGELEVYAANIRLDAVRIWKKLKGPLSGMFSIADIYTAFFLNFVDSNKYISGDRNRVRFIPKGTSAGALYAAAAYAGLIDPNRVKNIDKNDLEIVPTKTGFSDASLYKMGTQLEQGIGMALAGKYQGENYPVVVFLTDGGLQLGVDHPAKFAARMRLNNLTLVVDVNGLQSAYRTDQIDPTLLGDKEGRLSRQRQIWESYGWKVIEIDGHNFDEIQNAFEQIGQSERPLIILARTVKGKGVPFIENNVDYNHKLNNTKELELLEQIIQDKVNDYINQGFHADYSTDWQPGSIDKDNQGLIMPHLTPTSGIDLETYLKLWIEEFTELNPSQVAVINTDNPSPFPKNTPVYSPSERSPHIFAGINERFALNLAVGLSNEGVTPIYIGPASHMPILSEDWKMLSLDKQNVLVISRAAGSAMSYWGPAHLTYEDVELFKTPGAVVYQPANAYDLSIILDNHYKIKAPPPAYIRLQETEASEINVTLYNSIEKRNQIFRDGFYVIDSQSPVTHDNKDYVAFVVSGKIVEEALQAGRQMKRMGIPYKIINVINLKEVNKNKFNEVLNGAAQIITAIDAKSESLSGLVFRALNKDKDKVIAFGVNDGGNFDGEYAIMHSHNIDSEGLLNAAKTSSAIILDRNGRGIDFNGINVDRHEAGGEIQFDPVMMQDTLTARREADEGEGSLSSPAGEEGGLTVSASPEEGKASSPIFINAKVRWHVGTMMAGNEEQKKIAHERLLELGEKALPLLRYYNQELIKQWKEYGDFLRAGSVSQEQRNYRYVIEKRQSIIIDLIEDIEAKIKRDKENKEQSSSPASSSTVSNSSNLRGIGMNEINEVTARHWQSVEAARDFPIIEVSPNIRKMFDENGQPRPFKGVVVGTWLDETQQSDFYKNVNDFQARLSARLAAAGLIQHFIPHTTNSVHLSVANLLTGEQPAEKYEAVKKAAAAAFEEIEEAGIPAPRFKVQGITAEPGLWVGLTLAPATASDEKTVNLIQEKIHEKTGIAPSDYIPHLTLAFQLNDLNKADYEKFYQILKEFQNVDLGEFVLDHLDLRQYSFVNTKGPATTDATDAKAGLIATISLSTVGGITMNRIDVDRQGNGVDIQFDPAVMQDIMQNGVEGFAPVIINLTPIPSILPLFGLDPANKEDEYAAVASLN